MRARALVSMAMAVGMLAGGCAALAVWSAPEKAPSPERAALALQVDGLFWQTLHGGEYQYMRLETKEGPKRVCWNSWIAPHNFEGFFLNFGDMLVKASDPDTAVKIYRDAQHTPDYASWPYRGVLEDRMRNAARNVDAFRQDSPPPGTPTLMVRSTYACMGCHQR